MAAMKQLRFMAMALDPSKILEARNMDVDAWQRDLLLSKERQVLLNCCRQAGKSTVVSALALHQALFTPNSLTLLLSPGQRQSSELFRKVLDGYSAIGRPLKASYETQLKIEFANGSRILCLPGVEATVRCFAPDLLVIDEASRVEDDLYRAVRPMLAVSQGRLVVMSTPFGQRGWFYEEWERNYRKPDPAFKCVRVSWKECPRITAEFIAEERKAMGDSWVKQEYECSFEALEGLVYPDFGQCLCDISGLLGKPVGGIDWGWRNPFAALWGCLDHDDVLWINNERYLRATSLHEHAAALPRGVSWYADPAGPSEITEFRLAGHVVRKGDNDIRLGIAAVTARLRTGRLRVVAHRCPNLVAEAKLYRYPTAQERSVIGEKPIDEHNHALGALRYLISRIDARFIAQLRTKAPAEGPVETEALDVGETAAAIHGAKINRPELDINDPNLWTTLD
jgi:Terminase large subunit, T4likevirus-type, N-terminal